MYGQGSDGLLKTSSTGIGGVASIIGGSAVLPNTSGNLPLMILSICTIVLGCVVIASFIISRIIAARYSK